MLTLLLSASLALAAPIGPQGEDPVPPFQDVGDAYILNFAEPGPTGTGMTLQDFVKVCQKATGINFTYNTDTAGLLQSGHLLMYGEKRVAKEDFYTFFQIMMIINDFVCSKIGPDHLAVVVIESMRTGQKGNLRKDAIHILPNEVESYADQPATMITTVVHLPNTDVRQLSNSMRQMFPDPNTQQMIAAGNTNSVILTGFGSNVAALYRMLKIVDEASATEAVVPTFEVIPLEFASADELADTLEQLLEASRRVVTNTQGKPSQGATTTVRQGQTEAKIMVDPRTNSLLVMSMPEDMPRIKELVARLDVEVQQSENFYHIYNLENVNAQALAEVLNGFLDDASRVDTGRPGGTIPASRQGSGGRASSTQEFVVVADEETNSLLIAASRTRYQEVLSLIERLDKRQDQVLIETALVELSGQDLLDIGVELGGASLPDAGETGAFGLTSFGLSSLLDTDGDGLPDSRVPIGSQGLMAGILDGDDFSIPMLISLLEENRQANVLSRPSVLVNNNGSARIESKDSQPTTTITGLTGGLGGQTQETFDEYVEAGIIMEISPSISASNYLRLDISLQISTFLGTVSGSIPPPKAERNIQTTVNIPDGDTMVIGGIVTDTVSKQTTGIPFLKDLPLIGHLFKRNTEQEDKTTLYFFVTPHIMRDPDFADLAEYSFQRKLEAADSIGADRIQTLDPSFGQSDGDDSITGFDVPLYTSPERGEVEGQDVGLEAREVSDRLDDASGGGSEE
jgi:general secretion pathway protein D